MNRRLRRRHRYLVALVAAGVLIAALLVARRPRPEARVEVLPAELGAPAHQAQPGRQP